MPSQIVRLPADVFAVVFDHHKELALALPPGRFDVTASAHHAPVSVELWMCRGAFVLRPPSDSMVPALVIAPENGTFSFWPRPLPESEVRNMLDAVEPAMASLTALTGHQGLLVAEAIEQSRQAPATGARPVTPLSAGSAWQQRLLAKAQKLTLESESALGALAGKLTSYQARNQASDLDRVITRLDAHAHLGRHLQLRPRPDGKFVAALSAESRRGSLAGTIAAAQAQELAALSAHQYFSPFGYPADPDTGTLGWLNRLVRGASWKYKAYQELRTDDQPASGLAGKPAFPPRIPAEAVPKALEAWLDDMQPGRWPGVHPIVQASFALVELMAIRPFRTGNGRLARILFAEALRDRGLPVIAWNTAIEREFGSYQAALEAALNAGAYERLIAFLLRACELASLQADRMAAVLEPERRKLTQALEHRTFDDVAIGHETAFCLAEDLIGGVLVEGFTPRLQFVPMRSLLRDLATEGLLDLVATPHGTWASISAIRRLFAD